MPQANPPTQNNRLLAEIPLEIFERSFSDLPVVSLSLKEVIYEIGAPLKYVYFVQQGIISILATMTSGWSTEVAIIGMEGLVGLPALLGDTVSGRLVLVQAPGQALRMDAADLKGVFEERPAVRAVMLRYMGALKSPRRSPPATNCTCSRSAAPVGCS